VAIASPGFEAFGSAVSSPAVLCELYLLRFGSKVAQITPLFGGPASAQPVQYGVEWLIAQCNRRCLIHFARYAKWQIGS
jgi:hypothetical protein